MRHFLLSLLVCSSLVVQAEVAPIFYETFDGCIDAEDENYGYTGGNDNQWGGDVATAQAIYDDNDGWNYTYCNGGLQCVKVGTSKKQGSLTTPAIECSGDVVLSFRAAPWSGDSILTVSYTGGGTKQYNLKKNQWNEISMEISNVQGSLKVTFSSLYKHRFFLDDVKVSPKDPDAPSIYLPDGKSVDFGYVGCYYSSQTRTIRVEGANLAGEISASLEGGEASRFAVSPSKLPKTGGELTLTLKADASVGQTWTYLKLSAKDASNNTIEKTVTVLVEVGEDDLEGSGTKADPFTIADRLTLAKDGTVWEGTYYWVTGYVLGAVKRYNNTFDGISLTDNTSLVLAATPDETNMNKIVTVQIGHDARVALNVVDNPELIGQQIKVQGILVYGTNATYEYLGKPGVRNVNNDNQYVRPAKVPAAVETVESDKTQPMYDILGRRVGEDYHGIVIQAGRKRLQ